MLPVRGWSSPSSRRTKQKLTFFVLNCRNRPYTERTSESLCLVLFLHIDSLEPLQRLKIIWTQISILGWLKSVTESGFHKRLSLQQHTWFSTFWKYPRSFEKSYAHIFNTRIAVFEDLILRSGFGRILCCAPAYYWAEGCEPGQLFRQMLFNDAKNPTDWFKFMGTIREVWS